MKLELKIKTAVFKVLAKRIKRVEKDLPEFFRNEGGPILREGLMDTFLQNAHKWRHWSPFWKELRGRLYAKGATRRVNMTTRRKMKFPPSEPEYIGRATGALFTALTAKRSAVGSFRKYDGKSGRGRYMVWGVRTDTSRGIPYAVKFNAARPIRIYTPASDTMIRAGRRWIISRLAGKATARVKI